MKEANSITVTYDKPKKYWFVIEFGDGKYDVECKKVCDTYDEAIKFAHECNNENNEEFYYIVCESKYYTGSKTARFWGLEFEDNIDSGDMI
jgi:hypothetical protein